MRYLRVALLLSGLFAVVLPAQPQRAHNVPPAVRKAYRAKYDHGGVAWRRDTARTYIADFRVKGRKVKASFDSSGTWIETASTIRRAKLSNPLRLALARDFRNYKILEVRKITRPRESQSAFEIHLANDREIVHAQYSGDGTLLSKTARPKTK